MAENAVKLAVVTGGHSYDVPNFHLLFRSLEGVEPYIQHMDEFASSPKDVRQWYDAVLFYIMLMDGPTDEHLPWYAGKPKTALEELGQTPQGIVVLHHAILAYPQWSKWSELVGIDDRRFAYHMGQRLRVDVADTSHPITSALKSWEMPDETYTMADAEPVNGNQVLLTANHPRSMKTLAWTRQHGQSRVFCLQSGHDNLTWADPSFQRVLQRGVLWCAGRT